MVDSSHLLLNRWRAVLKIAVIGFAMNVTKKNFEEAADEIERLLPSVEFVAIDEEMTGISLPGFEEQIADSPAQRYGKMRIEHTIFFEYNTF